MRGWTGLVVAACCLCWVVVACESDGGTADVGVTDAGVDSGPVGTGPPSACGGIGVGTWVSGEGAGSPLDDTFTIRIGAGNDVLDIMMTEGSDVFLLANASENDTLGTPLSLAADGLSVEVSDLNGISGTAFDDVNDGWGLTGNKYGRICFHEAPQPGVALTGSFVFVGGVGEAGDPHRVQGTFSIPGEAVQAGPPALDIHAYQSATIVLE